MTDTPATKTQEIYEKLVHQVLTGSPAEAVHFFHAESPDQMAILARAVKDIRSHLGHARDLVGERVRELERAPALDVALTRSRARLQDLDRALDLTLSLVKKNVLDREVTLELVRVLELARARDRDPSFERVLNPIYQMSLFLASLEGNASRPEGQGSTITLRGVEALTPRTLSQEVAPYLQAIWDLYVVIAEITKTEIIEPAITSISQDAPFAITFSGPVEEAITAITTLVSRWHKDYGIQLAILEEAHKKAEIGKLQAEVAEINYKAQSPDNASKWTTVELDLAREEARRLALENEKHQAKLYKTKIELCLSIIRQFAPNLAEAERQMVIQRLIKPLDVLGQSRLEIDSSQ